ncbi:hypothetical protein GOP47_0007964 [Adiantum capillus-veneris]|uniref:ARM repeat superfamily protein n=1 Tax=Adiantum capillus-veneris TaxID=13818 RepID=A0A9D4V298_ADICA|nr:hypothetical protein GOP47_0007964 [Adiantum capillus-veneris]
MVRGKTALVDGSAGYTMSSSIQSSLPALLGKLEDKDPKCRKTSLEAIRELMQREVVQEKSMNNFMGPFINTLLGTLDKKSKHQLLVEQSPYSQLAHSSAVLLAELAHHATHHHLRLSLHHITSIAKHLVSWFPLDLGPASQSRSLHQACAKLVCSLADNAALHVRNEDDDVTKTSSSTGSSASFTHSTSYDTSDMNDNSSSSSSSNYANENPHQQQYCAAVAMESLCRPLIAALCSKVEPISRGATTCLEPLVSMGSWRVASPSLIEELCLRAVNVMQERTILSTSIAQMSLLSSLAEKNCESLSYFRAGLLKKGADILLCNGAWQQRVAAARMIECLLSMGSHESMWSKPDKQAVTQAMEALEHCKIDKLAMVRSSVIEALRKAKLQRGLDKGHNSMSTAGVASTPSCTTMKSTCKVDYRKRRRKKPLCGPCEKQPDLSSPPFSGNDRWSNKVTPISGWSSSDSVDSFINGNCPRKKVARTTSAHDGKTGASRQKIRQLNVHSVSSSLTISPSSSSSSVAVAPSSSSSSINVRPSMEEMTESALHAPHTFLDSKLSNKLEKCMDSFASSSEEEYDVHETHNVDHATNNHACATEQKCNSCATPTYIHHNPIAQLESLEEVENLEVSKSCDVPPATTSISLLLSMLENTKLQSMDVAEGMKRIELLNDKAWNIRNNPIATDDSELGSPKSRVFDGCSTVYCADGDEERYVRGRQPKDKDDHPVYAREHQKGDDDNIQGTQADVIDVQATEYLQEGVKFVYNGQHVHVEGHKFANKGQHGHAEDVEGDDGFVDLHSFSRKEQQGCGIDDGSKQNEVDTLGYCAVDGECRDDSNDCKGDVEAREKHGSLLARNLSEGGSANQLHMQEDFKAVSTENSDSVLVSKGVLIGCEETQERDKTAWHNVNACKFVSKQYCSSAEKCTLKENNGHCTPGSSTLSTEDGGIDHAAIKDGANLEKQSSKYQEQCFCHADDSHPLVSTDEHEGIGDNFCVLTHPHDNHEALRNEPDFEPSRCECFPSEPQLKGSIEHEEDIRVLGPGKDIEALQAYSSVRKRLAHGQEDECRGNSVEESGNSVVRWLRECYVVKKLGAFGTLFLAISIPLAIVSFINTFDTKEDVDDFLVPT